MKVEYIGLAALGLATTAFLLAVPTWSFPPIRSTDYGPAETEMVVFKDPRRPNGEGRLPPPQPDVAPVAAGGPGASAAYRNVQVLGGLPKAEFDRTMVAITRWVAPREGCGFCHGGQTADYAADYPRKEIARRMLAMVRTVNANWTNHVGTRGVTCYSCHTGENVPRDRWYLDTPQVPPEGGLLGRPQAWDTNAKTIREFFPNRPFRMFYLQGLPAHDIQSHQALPTTDKPAFEHDRDYAEQVYIVMMQMSEGLGVNCTYCHQSRSIYDWNQSPPNRLHGYSGIKMTTMLNQNFLAGLERWTPPGQLGRMGDSAKVDCRSCHQGLERPVGGMGHAVYPGLIGPIPAGPANPVAAWNPTIPQLARAPRVGQPATDTLVQFRGVPQR